MASGVTVCSEATPRTARMTPTSNISVSVVVDTSSLDASLDDMASSVSDLNDALSSVDGLASDVADVIEAAKDNFADAQEVANDVAKGALDAASTAGDFLLDPGFYIPALCVVAFFLAWCVFRCISCFLSDTRKCFSCIFSCLKVATFCCRTRKKKDEDQKSMSGETGEVKFNLSEVPSIPLLAYSANR